MDKQSFAANLEYYKSFYYVARLGTVTAAADALCLTQPTVTSAIRKLEEQLGCPLFLRTKRGMSLTAEGALLSPLFPPGLAPTREELRAPAAALERRAGGPLGRRLRLLPYQAVGVEHGLLLALRVDSARVGAREYGSILVALSPNRLSDGGGYGGLIGAD